MKRFVLLAALLLFGFYIVWPAFSAYQIRQALEARDSTALAGRIDFPSVRESLRPAATKEVGALINERLQKSGGAAGVLAGDIAKKAMPKLVDASLNALATPENIVRIYAEGGSVKDTLTRVVGQQFGNAGGLTGLGTFKPPKIDTGGSGALGGMFGGISSALGLSKDKPEPAKVDSARSPVRTVNPANDRPALMPTSPVRTVGGAPAAAAAPEVAKPGYGLGNIKRFGPTGPLSLELGFAKDAAAKDADITAEMSFTGTGWKLTGLRPRL